MHRLPRNSNYFFRVPMEILKRKMFLGKSKIIINFLINIIINAHNNNNFIINSLYNYFISNRVLLDECDKEENVQVTEANITFCVLRKYNIFAPSAAGRRLKNRYPVNTSQT